MQFLTTILSVGALVSVAHAQETVSVSYDENYDNPSLPIDNIACSNAFPGLTTIGQIPAFANLGGAPTISGYGSPACGQCYELNYQGTTVNVLGIDTGARGFNIALGAMNRLTNNQGIALGRVNAVYTQVDVSACVGGPPGDSVDTCPTVGRRRRYN
ncbi:allergen Asp F13 [Bisporella sp. PMI_857]|nr:allergen Asp F13 [Bisporella sp. PMI_857]